MDRPTNAQSETAGLWKVCLECGNRFQRADHGYRVNWCSATCESASLRRQRDQIETSWARARWFLR